MTQSKAQKSAKGEAGVSTEQPKSLRWVIREREDLEAELNSRVHRAPDFSRDLICRVVKSIEGL